MFRAIAINRLQLLRLRHFAGAKTVLAFVSQSNGGGGPLASLWSLQKLSLQVLLNCMTVLQSLKHPWCNFGSGLL